MFLISIGSYTLILFIDKVLLHVDDHDAAPTLSSDTPRNSIPDLTEHPKHIGEEKGAQQEDNEATLLLAEADPDQLKIEIVQPE